MRVSFDLDEVLFVDARTIEAEDPLPFPLNRIFIERLRKGTPGLIHKLQSRGFEVWIYTSSFRSTRYISTLFRNYGIRFDQIVNGSRHLQEVQGQKKEPLPQKLPTFYHIALHIDDEEAIHANGKAYGFKTFKVCEQDDQWAEKVLAEAERIRDLEARKEAARKQGGQP